jgi:hypothetical protein
MADQWMIRGIEFSNCNCDWGCPCQFNAPTTHGFCEAVGAGRVDEGKFNDTKLDGLHWVMLLRWPGEIADGNGTSQMIIDERADAEQYEAMRKILHGESTAPGATHFFVFASTMSEMIDPITAPFETFEVDVEARRAQIVVPGLVELSGSPITDPNSGEEFRARIDLPGGFEYTTAEMGTGESRTRAGLEINLSGSYGQFNAIHMNQDGVIR